MERDKLLIYIIDDSSFSRNQLSQTLANHGFTNTQKFEDATASFQNLQNKKPDLAIIDVVMPKTSGFEVARKFKEIDKSINIIMISSLSQERIILESISAGAMDFLQKPITESALIDSVEKALSIKASK